MAWPLSQDYNEALQNPQTSFSDPELRQGQVVTNVLGIPQPCSGNFADVYAVECEASKTKWAVKCFTREVHGLRERYSEISKYLQQVRLPFTVDFQYLEQGIRIAGRWYPILKMHWVEGFTLNAFVRDMLDKPAMLDALGQIWLRMGRRLREANLGHCDLQHGNVLLVPGSTAQSLAVKLIDYDGMWVPALAKTPSGEVGHPAYQHPQRLRDGTYNAEVDRFPLLVIATALRCLRVGGRALWERYDTGDNMLFREVDLRAPAESALFAELRQINDPLARSLVEQLVQASQKPLDQTPLLQELFPDEKPAVSAGTRGKPQAARTTAAVTTEPNAFQDIETTSTGKRSRRKTNSAKRTSVVPWIVGGVVAACILIGSGLFWVLHSKSARDKTLPTPDLRQAQALRGELVKKPEDNLPPQPVERPTDKNPENKRPKPAMVQLLDGPPGEVRRFEGHAGDVIDVAFSGDGKRALTASADKSVRLWDVASGETIHILNGHTQMVWSVAFSPDGKRAVSAGYDSTVRVWDLDKGEQLRAITGYPGAVRRAVFTADGRQVIAAGMGKSVRRCDAMTGAEVSQYAGSQADNYCLALAPKGDVVLAGEGDNIVHCWNVADGRELDPYKGSISHVYALDCSHDGQLIAAAGGDPVVRIWRASDRTLLHSLAGHSAQVNAVRFTPDGRLLSASHDQTVRLWDMATGRELARFYGPEGCKMLSVAVSPDGRHFLSGGSDKMMRLWRLPPADVLASKPDDPAKQIQPFEGHTAEINGVTFAPDGRLALSGSSDGIVRLWDLPAGKEVRQLTGHQDKVQSVAFSPDGRLALTGALDKTARIWDVGEGRELFCFRGHNDWVRSVAFSPDGKRALTASGGPGNVDCTVRLWDVADGKEIQTLRGHNKPVTAAVFSPDGRRAISGSDDGTVRLWDLADGREVRKYTGHLGFVYGIAVSGDGRLAASVGDDKTVRLWDLQGEKELLRLDGHTDLTMCAAFSPDSRRILSGSLDKTLRLWDTATGRELASFKESQAGVKCVAFSPDGRHALSGGLDKLMRLWRLPFAPLMFGRPVEIKTEPAPPPPPVAAKLPVPDKDAQKKWTDDIREKYKLSYASKDSADLAALADKLFAHGMKKTEQSEGRYIYLVEASDVAAKAADPVLSLRAVDELGKLFVIAELPMKAVALQTAVKAAKTLSANKAILESALPLLAEAIETDDYDAGERLAKTAEAAGYQTRDSTRRILFLANEVKRLKRLKPKYPAVKLALETLVKEPNDPRANGIVGSFRCFDKGDWARGLPLLALGDDAKIKTLAEQDLAAPQTADARAAVGDGWWNLAQPRAKGAVKANIQQRACYWYVLALADAAEKNRVRLEKRIRGYNNDYPTAAWEHLDISQATVTLGALRLDKKAKQIITRESYSGPIEVTVLTSTEKNNIRLYGGKGAYVIFNHESEPGGLELGRPDGEQPYTGSKVRSRLQPPLRPKTWYLLSWRISEEGMSAGVNGRVAYSEDHKNNLSGKYPIHLQTFDSDIEILSFTVRPLKKKSN
ncbi:MAG TPA: WD40 repeat domain-containing serine/threonine-protein kinase [Gemmataceae bacterium]|nr:WD40 repeat domain-containing serine/threonine-protein kinase [Gemmataceae bacterium]